MDSPLVPIVDIDVDIDIDIDVCSDVLNLHAFIAVYAPVFAVASKNNDCTIGGKPFCLAPYRYAACVRQKCCCGPHDCSRLPTQFVSDACVSITSAWRFWWKS